MHLVGFVIVLYISFLSREGGIAKFFVNIPSCNHPSAQSRYHSAYLIFLVDQKPAIVAALHLYRGVPTAGEVGMPCLAIFSLLFISQFCRFSFVLYFRLA